MKILIIEPFLTGSHASWAREYQKYSSHKVEILGMSGHYWKWRMHGGAVTLARKFMGMNYRPDLILASDMVDLSTFMALTREVTHNIKTALYFHENQLTYPWSETDQDLRKNRDNHYSFINYVSALTADMIFFNSEYHMGSFLGELPRFLKSFPDNHELNTVETIKKKSFVLHLGLDLKSFDRHRVKVSNESPLILWNHRWEYDKNPEEFFNVLFRLSDEGLDFNVAILGESYSKAPKIFFEAKERLGNRIVQFGYAKDFGDYAKWLWKADIVPVTSVHDFFGVSVVQAIYCSCYPILPKRLAYPEHVPSDLHADIFYHTTVELADKLRTAILNYKDLKTDHLSSFVERYDWGRMASLYDSVF